MIFPAVTIYTEGVQNYLQHLDSQAKIHFRGWEQAAFILKRGMMHEKAERHGAGNC
ncbi:hypothetical protein PbJCM17693_47190 [Paenibacillus macerans]|nr:hypothetical protein PbJCM17693_47190 [Paenibacillus macerans]